MSRSLRVALGGCLTAALLAVVATAWTGLRIATYDIDVSEPAMAEKQRYLAELPKAQRGPNIVLIVFDDLGLGDIGAYGAEAIATPHLDALAAQGARYTDFYAAAPTCTPSRAAMMTGRYPIRSGLTRVIAPPRTAWDFQLKARGKKVGLSPDEITIAEVLRASGYRTGLVGKWHLGGEDPVQPQDFGFETFFGVHCSNDQAPMHLFEGKQRIEDHPVDQSTLTARYTQQAVRFIDDHAGEPFFLYVAHTFPHEPLHSAQEGSMGGLYGDVVEELDISTGAIVAALEAAGVAEDTLILATSDNGPWYQGDPGGLRGRKFEVFEGGVRVPMIARWPRTIAPGTVISTPAMNIDLLPTVLSVAGVAPPQDRVLDGEPLPWTDEGTRPERALYFYWRDALYAMRRGRFKVHDRHRLAEFNPIHPLPWAPADGPWLFDLVLDPREAYDVSERHPAVFEAYQAELSGAAAAHGANPRGWALQR